MVETTFGVLLVEPVKLEDGWVLMDVVEVPEGDGMIVGRPLVMPVKIPPRPATVELGVVTVLEVVGVLPPLVVFQLVVPCTNDVSQ